MTAGLSLLAGVLGILTFSAIPAQAATQVVSNCNDSGHGSLRQAVRDAPAGGAVTFVAPLGCLHIVLTSGPIDFTSDLSVEGPDLSELSVSGNDASQVFVVAAGATVNISGLTVEDGSTADMSEGRGGGINNAGNLTLRDSGITGNNAYIGGGINNSGVLDLLQSTVSTTVKQRRRWHRQHRNTDRHGFLYHPKLGGRGWWRHHEYVQWLRHGRRLNDFVYSGEYGAGIETFTRTTVNGSTLSDNNGTYGGGIYTEYGGLTMSSSTVYANSATEGGGIYVDQDLLTIAHGTVSDNAATQGGGGIFTDGTSDLEATIAAGPVLAEAIARTGL